MAYDNALKAEEWGAIYNIESQARALIKSIEQDALSHQTREMLRLVSKGEKTLEIGCGSGQSSLCLALAGCEVTLLDFSVEVLALASYAADYFKVPITTVLHDATTRLPFERHEFDYIFHAGLLEHFEKADRVDLLKAWRPFCKKMVSMIPNAASFCYALGKERQEEEGSWQWGRELPDYTQIREFMLAGYDVEHEFTVGEIQALDFLKKDDPLRQQISALWAERRNMAKADNFHQGYLLVTVGANVEQ